MKSEINLRTREFVASREFNWSRVLATIIALVLIFLLLAGPVMISLYRIHLTAGVNRLSELKRQKEAQAEKAEELGARISALEKVAALKMELQQQAIPWAERVALLDSIAAVESMAIQEIKGSGDGNISLAGSASRMRDIGRFILTLEKEDCLTGVYFTSIALESDTQRYHYQIRALQNFAVEGLN